MINLVYLAIVIFIFSILRPTLKILNYQVKLMKAKCEKDVNPVKELNSKDVC